MLDKLQQFEQESGRVRLRHWGERTLDLDLLIYGQQQIQNERLTVPHVGVLERDFVLIPLLDLDPNLVVNDQLIKDLDVKGSTLNAKIGTAVRNIRLVHNNTEQIEGKIDGQQIVILTKFVKKQS